MAEDVELWAKYENQQVSGSFKARGVFNKLLCLSEGQRSKQYYVAASTGNHAAAFCYGLRELGLRGKVFLPETISRAKMQFILSTGIAFELVGANSLETELYCREQADQHGYLMVPPYNDPDIIAGQGTAAVEMLLQVPQLDTLVVPVGGGGLMSGVGHYVRSQGRDIWLVGCQPVQSPEMVESVRRGAIVTEDLSRPTLSDGTAGGMEPDSITFELCKSTVDEWALIKEEEIAREIVGMLESQQILIEGSAALGLAYVRKNAALLRGRKVGVIITGKRIGLSKLKALLTSGQDVETC